MIPAVAVLATKSGPQINADRRRYSQIVCLGAGFSVYRERRTSWKAHGQPSVGLNAVLGFQPIVPMRESVGGSNCDERTAGSPPENLFRKPFKAADIESATGFRPSATCSAHWGESASSF
jgi:hypothetical protein